MCHYAKQQTAQASEEKRQPEKEESMSAFLATFIETAVKFVILGAIAFAGIVCGRKFRNKKNQQKQ